MGRGREEIREMTLLGTGSGREKVGEEGREGYGKQCSLKRTFGEENMAWEERSRRRYPLKPRGKPRNMN